MKQYQEVDNQISAGSLWRAKEILQGRLADSTYDVILFERYGDVLLRMNDLVEAGKYLFLSGVRKPEYLDAINLYIGRHANNTIDSLFHTFPSAAKTVDITEFPNNVISELEAIGFKLKKIKQTVTRKVRPSDTLRNKIMVVIALIFGLALLTGLLTQSVRGLVWLYQFIIGLASLT